ncbi:MAG: hypothetical protein KatS3mg115_0399 [Candidatus Poribacteria bacterium]|nr:MAG: hypothetical protein KatS3mg115_0399 [Candidatus Poribacteria bacterium]
MSRNLLEAWHLALNRFVLDLETCRDLLRGAERTGPLPLPELRRRLLALSETLAELEGLFPQIAQQTEAALQSYEQEVQARLDRLAGSSQRIIGELRALAGEVKATSRADQAPGGPK